MRLSSRAVTQVIPTSCGRPRRHAYLRRVYTSTIVPTNWGIGTVWDQDDFNYDIAVGLADLTKVQANWSPSVDSLIPAPEPSIAIMLPTMITSPSLQIRAAAR